MTSNPPTARIPIGRSVVYAVRGMPDVPNQYGPGSLVPTEITLTYRSTEDSQLGRVHAYVAGRLWVDGVEIPLMSGGLYGQHYDAGLDNWPEWLAEEARLHDPDAALPEPPSRAAGQDEVDRLAEWLWDNCAEDERSGLLADDPRRIATVALHWPELRRVADEAQQQEPDARPGELKPWQLLGDVEGPVPQTERVIGGRRLTPEAQQQPETEARPVSLATPCILCQHPFNWHDRKGCQFGNEVNRCGCRAFSPGEKPAPVDPRTILGIAAPVEPAAADSEETRRCACPHPADEHSVYGCVDGCGCEWMPRRKSRPAPSS